MGNRLTEEETKPSATPYGDIFDELCPHFVAMGMPYDLYWDGEYGTKTAYREAYRIRMENEQKLADANNWYLGQYLIRVFQSIPLFVNGFVPKGTSFRDYPDKPFLEEAEQRKKEEVRKKKEEDQSMVAMAMFQAMVSKFNKNIEKRLEQEKQNGSGQ